MSTCNSFVAQATQHERIVSCWWFLSLAQAWLGDLYVFVTFLPDAYADYHILARFHRCGEQWGADRAGVQREYKEIL